MVPALLGEARHAIAVLTAETGGRGERTQRVAFAVHRLADTLETTTDLESREATATDDRPSPADGSAVPGDAAVPGLHTASGPEQGHRAATEAATGRATPVPPATDARTPEPARPDPAGPGAPRPDTARTLRLTTRQALQAGVAVGLSIVVGELVSPARWYWAAIAAFVVFAGTNSRGDILTRGWQRILGTIGGVAAGMGLAVVVGDRAALAVPALVACMFLALYLVRISQALMAFWVTAVLALMYGLIGQFSLATLVLRIEETAAGALMGMLAGFVVLPRRTRDAYTETRDDLVAKVDATLAAATDQLLGRVPSDPPVELARDADAALSTLRDRTAPLAGPWRRATAGYRDTLHVLAGIDHYARALARRSDGVRAPDWAPVLQPAVDRVRANLGVLCRIPAGRPADRDTAAARRDRHVHPAEELVDAAEAWAARRTDTQLRHELLEVARLLRRIDQSVLTLVGAPPVAELRRR